MNKAKAVVVQKENSAIEIVLNSKSDLSFENNSLMDNSLCFMYMRNRIQYDYQTVGTGAILSEYGDHPDRPLLMVNESWVFLFISPSRKCRDEYHLMPFTKGHQRKIGYILDGIYY